MEKEIASYKKKKKHSNPKKTNHKHIKVQCVVKNSKRPNNPLYMLGWYCSICNKIGYEKILLFPSELEAYKGLETKVVLK